MTLSHRRGSATLFTLAITAACCCCNAVAMAESPGQSSVASAAKQNKFAFVMFYRANDATTQSMYKVLKSELAARNDSAIVVVNITDAKEKTIVDQYDASRTPMPAVMAVAPNGAITGVFAKTLAPAQVDAAIVTPAQHAACEHSRIRNSCCCVSSQKAAKKCRWEFSSSKPTS